MPSKEVFLPKLEALNFGCNQPVSEAQAKNAVPIFVVWISSERTGFV